jgi:hypothetical protein
MIKVPIIKFRDRETSVHVDISFNMPNGPEDALVIKVCTAAGLVQWCFMTILAAKDEGYASYSPIGPVSQAVPHGGEAATATPSFWL